MTVRYLCFYVGGMTLAYPFRISLIVACPLQHSPKSACTVPDLDVFVQEFCCQASPSTTNKCKCGPDSEVRITGFDWPALERNIRSCAGVDATGTSV